jgi:hypothetical protein
MHADAPSANDLLSGHAGAMSDLVDMPSEVSDGVARADAAELQNPLLI